MSLIAGVTALAQAIAADVKALYAGKVDKVTGKGLSSTDYTQTEKDKLSAVAPGATANSSDAALLNRVNHTGAQGISTVTGLPAALDAKIATSLVGAASGVASLDSSGKIPTSQLPPLAVNEVFTVATQAAMLALTAERGDVAIRTDLAGKAFILTADAPGTLANWISLDQALSAALAALNSLTPAADRLPYFDSASTAQLAVFTAQARTFMVAADQAAQRTAIGVGSVDNTADSAKPLSTPQAAAILSNSRQWNGTVSNSSSDRTLLVSEAGGAFRFTPTAPITVTLPPSGAQPPAGMPYLLRNESLVAITVTATGIIYTSSGAQGTTLILAAGEFIEIASNVSSWVVNERGNLAKVLTSGSPEGTGNLTMRSFGTSLNTSFDIIKSRGTEAAPAQVLSGDRIGAFSWSSRGADGTNYPNVVMEAYVREDQTATARGAILQIATVKTGEASRSVALQINDLGQVSMPNGFVAALPGRFAQYTLATLPNAATYNGYTITVTNAAGGAKVCMSNGTAWQILNTTTTVS